VTSYVSCALSANTKRAYRSDLARFRSVGRPDTVLYALARAVSGRLGRLAQSEHTQPSA
jgi:hypothetical protein